MTDGSRKAIFAAFFANGAITIAKFVGFLITRSASMLAESVHSAADTGNQALLFLGGNKAKKKASKVHQFGYARERYFWSFAVALVLFSLGGMFALYEGIQKLQHPHEVDNIGIAVGILIFAILLEGYSLRTAVKEAQHVKPKDQSWWTFVRATKQPELSVVLLEDVGAETGLFLALGGVLLAETTGNPRWDAAGSTSIGVLLIVIAVILIIEMKALLIGESADEGVQQSIVDAIESHPKIDRLIHMRTQHLGPDDILVGAKVEFASALSADELVATLNATEDAIRAAVPAATTIYLEPDLHSADHPDLDAAADTPSAH